MSAVILAIGVIYFVAHFFTALFEKTKIPDVLLLIILGMLGGPVFGIISPEDFGKVGPVMTTMALIIILFQGGTTLNLRTLGAALGPTLGITLPTFILTVGAVTLLAHVFIQVSWPLSVLIGVIVGGTSSAVVIPMVTGMKLREPPATILILESALTDVLCIIIAVGLLTAFVQGEFAAGKLVSDIFVSLGVATVVGVLGGFLWLLVLNIARKFPNTMFTTLAFIFILYGINELLGFSGAITALTFGITMTNYKGLRFDRLPFLKKRALSDILEEEKNFYKEVVFLLKIFFFLFLGISIKFDNFSLILLGLILVSVIYGARFVVVRLIGSRKTHWKDAAVMSVMVPKGLASAVLAGLPLQMGIDGGETIQTAVYMTVLMSIIVTAVMITLIEKTAIGTMYQSLFASFGQDADFQEKAPAESNLSQAENGQDQLNQADN